ncbi:DUF1501 domain-containing protein [bacterium]|nr:DUF1501 domain-containing protein [bacterium]
MLPDTLIFSRRGFLQSLAVAGLAASLPSFLTETVMAQQAKGITPGFKDDRILVVIQLGGGNDGLNAVIPHGDDSYYRLRKNIAVEKKDMHRLSDDVALNGGMTAFKDLFDKGELSILQGVGYPNPNRSHFRSMEIWHTGTDADRYSKTGWIGRYFDNACAGTPNPLAGVNIGREMPQSFASARGMGVSFDEPKNFGWAGQGRATREAFNAVNHTAEDHGEHRTIDFLRHVTATAMASSDRVLRASATNRKPVEYPNSRLSTQLRTVATLIAGGLPTRIYYTSMSGFDTHSNQLNQHANLLRQFTEAAAAFNADLKAIGVADRVQILCFSEFGRRVEENASRGTDHGTAGPMFMLGAGIKPGIHGTAASLTDLDEGDLKHTQDFRAVYAEVLQRWLGTDPKLVLDKEWQLPGVLA